MSDNGLVLADRFVGCLLGLAIGDALGAHFEGQSADHIAGRFPTVAFLGYIKTEQTYDTVCEPPAQFIVSTYWNRTNS